MIQLVHIFFDSKIENCVDRLTNTVELTAKGSPPSPPSGGVKKKANRRVTLKCGVTIFPKRLYIVRKTLLDKHCSYPVYLEYINLYTILWLNYCLIHDYNG